MRCEHVFRGRLRDVVHGVPERPDGARGLVIVFVVHLRDRVHHVLLVRVGRLLLVRRDVELRVQQQLLLLVVAHCKREQLPRLGREPVHHVLLLRSEPLLLVHRIIELCVQLQLLLLGARRLAGQLPGLLVGREPVHFMLLLRVGRLLLVQRDIEVRIQQQLLLLVFAHRIREQLPEPNPVQDVRLLRK